MQHRQKQLASCRSGGGVFSFRVDSETARAIVEMGRVTWKDDRNAIVTKEDLAPMLAEVDEISRMISAIRRKLDAGQGA